jgi:hypothetical protein
MRAGAEATQVHLDPAIKVQRHRNGGRRDTDLLRKPMQSPAKNIKKSTANSSRQLGDVRRDPSRLKSCTIRKPER